MKCERCGHGPHAAGQCAASMGDYDRCYCREGDAMKMTQEQVELMLGRCSEPMRSTLREHIEKVEAERDEMKHGNDMGVDAMREALALRQEVADVSRERDALRERVKALEAQVDVHVKGEADALEKKREYRERVRALEADAARLRVLEKDFAEWEQAVDADHGALYERIRTLRAQRTEAQVRLEVVDEERNEAALLLRVAEARVKALEKDLLDQCGACTRETARADAAEAQVKSLREGGMEWVLRAIRAEFRVRALEKDLLDQCGACTRETARADVAESRLSAIRQRLDEVVDGRAPSNVLGWDKRTARYILGPEAEPAPVQGSHKLGTNSGSVDGAWEGPEHPDQEDARADVPDEPTAAEDFATVRASLRNCDREHGVALGCIARLERRMGAMVRAMADAPHGGMCRSGLRALLAGCDCWKSRALTGAPLVFTLEEVEEATKEPEWITAPATEYSEGYREGFAVALNKVRGSLMRLRKP